MNAEKTIVRGFDTYRFSGYVAFELDASGQIDAAHSQQTNAIALAGGDYQRDLLTGREASSGGTLTGKAARYIGKYRESRDNLFDRMRDAGIAFDVRRFRGAKASGKRIDRDVLVFLAVRE